MSPRTTDIVILLKYLISGLTLLCTVMLVLSCGCTGDILTKAGVGNFGGTPSPTSASGMKSTTAGSGGSNMMDAEYHDCMDICTRNSGQGAEQCLQVCCISGCSENSPGGADACINRCLGVNPPLTTSAPSGFTCDYDENLIRTSSDFRTWFNASCYYNTYCGWFESNDLLKPTPTPDCVNCSVDSFTWQPEATHTPCPARTTKPVPVVTTTSAPLSSSGTCGAGLTQCRVFSTDYCVDLMTDVKHCGSCRNGCLLHHAENGCAGGKCYIISCDKGWADCNGIPDDGCEVDLNADDNNCGTCGRVCKLPNAGYSVCNGVDENGKCEVEHCVAGWLNENGYHEDGCEAFDN